MQKRCEFKSHRCVSLTIMATDYILALLIS
jgi:hypothetical protein